MLTQQEHRQEDHELFLRQTNSNNADTNHKSVRIAKREPQEAGKPNFVSDEVQVHIEEAKNQEVRMLVDTGAEVSVINKACVKDDIAWKESEVQLVALSGGTIKDTRRNRSYLPGWGSKKLNTPYI